ncbi:MAG: glycosyltransferase family 39 protein [Chloroflexota bacterium]
MQRRLTDLHVLILLSCIRFVFHLLTNGQYGFHRDALAFLENGMHLGWGYVAYPPLTPLIGRIGIELFGLSLVGIKSFAALAQCIGMVFAGLIAKEMGGGRQAQVIAAIATAIAPMSLIMGTLFQYITFDYLWWVMIAYFMLRLLNSDNPRWWLGIGICIGLGMMTKYTMVVFVAAIVISVLLTNLRRHLFSPWLCGGVALSLLIFAPNLLWQFQHDFITLDFLNAIRARDAALGRTEGFLIQQLFINVNPLTLPLVPIGLYFFFATPKGTRYRAIGWLYVTTMLLFWLAEGRFYYTAPAYPMLLAAGVVQGEQWLTRVVERRQAFIYRISYGLLTAGATIGVILMLPIGPVGSPLWDFRNGAHDNFINQVGWEELAETVGSVYEVHKAEHESLGIISANHGQVSALNLYGSRYGLPTTISPYNSFWLRGYGTPTPTALLVIGFPEDVLKPYFNSCSVVGRIDNHPVAVIPESQYNFAIFLCSGFRIPLEDIWPDVQAFS